MLLKNCSAYVGIDWADEQHATCLIDARTKVSKLESLDQEPEAIEQWG